jgi:hypothetical protein
MEKKCIFNKESNCTNCGECDICDLDKNKICDSCGKCLKNTEDKEYRTLGIDSILDEDYSDADIDFENEDIDSSELSSENKSLDSFRNNSSSDYTECEEQDEWILIDDVPGLKEMIEDNDIPIGYSEEFPGLMIFKKEG